MGGKKALGAKSTVVKEAEKLGWKSWLGNPADLLPGKMIGGMIYKNRDRRLPEKTGRIRMGEFTVNYITLDFDGIKSLGTLHEYVKKVFNLPDYYGHNMDALWDCLDCSFEFPTTIVLKNIEKIPLEMNEAVKIMLELFDDLQYDNEKVTVRIESSGSGDDSPYMV